MKNFAELVNTLIGLLSSFIPLIFALTLVVLIWSVVNAWVINGGDENKIAEGKQTVLVGIIALVVMTAVWGILAVLQSSIF